MTETKHTPGPWEWFANANGDIRLATPNQGHLYVMGFARKGMQGATPRFSQWDGQRDFGNSGWMQDAAKFIKDGELRHPDALLIAASPELLEAAQEALALGSKVYHNANAHEATKNWGEVRRLLVAAIAKATGERS